MADLPSRYHEALVAWADECARLGWLSSDAAERFDAAGAATPGALFSTSERPLVVGLFGGTGVGKSSLLNRIAGREIARASAERPTSRDISAYVHDSVRIDRLPAEFPMQRLATIVHREPRWRDVLWIDMPDFDSVAVDHQTLVRQWLPHIDVVLYVVSPERYRDDRGWRLLVEHGAEHAWAFVMNHWDRADPRQLEDFRHVLEDAGFPEPQLFRTSAGAARVDDDFDALVALLESLADAQLIRDLEARGVLERLRRLDRTAAELGGGATDATALEGLERRWRTSWQDATAGIAGAVGTRVPGIVARASAGPTAGGEPGPDTPTTTASVLDGATLDRIDETVGRFVAEAASAGVLPRAVAIRHLDPVRAELPQRLADTLDAAIGRSIATPGTPFRRGLHRTFGALAVLMPLAAIGWVGTRVVAAFVAGGSEPALYLGMNFAINAALLVALAWALPWFLARRSRPAFDRALTRGIEAGFGEALTLAGERVEAALAATVAEHHALEARLARARAEVGLGTESSPAVPIGGDQDRVPDALRRLVRASSSAAAPTGGQGEPAAAVRAMTQSSTDAAPVS